jgi:glycosyltransferase involved in cell wall biosynthesis
MESSRAVCLLMESYLPVKGGMERGGHVLASELTARGCEVTILTRRVDPGTPVRETTDVGLVVRTGPVGTKSRLRWVHMFSCVPTLIRLRHTYDVLWVAGFRVLGLPAILTARLLEKRCILRAESCGEMDGSFFLNSLPRKGMGGVLVRLLVGSMVGLRNVLLRRADALVAISSEIRDEMLACRVSEDRLRVIHQSVDTDHFRPSASPDAKRALRQRLALPSDACVFVYTGRLVSYKGLPPLLEAWSALPAEVRATSHLLFVGEGGHDMFNCEQELRDTVAREGLDGSVTFAGAVDNVADYLQASDVFVFPTENEAFGISMIEAMAVGLPTISTIEGGVKDIVVDGETGLVVPAGDADALRRCICELAADPERRQQLGFAARQRVEDHFSQSAFGASCHALIMAD